MGSHQRLVDVDIGELKKKKKKMASTVESMIDGAMVPLTSPAGSADTGRQQE